MADPTYIQFADALGIEPADLLATVSSQGAAIQSLQTAMPPVFTYISTAGSGTFTPTAGALYFVVEVQSTGGPGSGSGVTPGNGTAAAATTFGPISAGAGGAASGSTGGAGGTNTITPTTGLTTIVNRTGQAGAAGANGYTFTIGAKGGGPYGGLAAPSQSGIAGSLGSGGSGGGVDSGTNAGGAGGGEGGYVQALVTVIAPSYSYSLAASPAGGATGTNGRAGGAGGVGFIKITEYFR